MPVPWRVIFPAVVSLVSGLWAIAEWRDHYGSADAIYDDTGDDLQAQRETRDRRQAAADDRAERALRLAELREARLASRQQPAPAAEPHQA